LSLYSFSLMLIINITEMTNNDDELEGV